MAPFSIVNAADQLPSLPLMKTLRAGRFLLVTLLATSPGAGQTPSPPDPAPPVARPHPRGFGVVQAQLMGAAAGLALGAALGRQPPDPIRAARPLGAADAILAGSAGALFLSAGLFHSGPPAGAAPNDDLNGCDRKIRTFAVGRRSLANRRLLDHVSSTTLMANLFTPVGLLAATDLPHIWTRDLPVIAEATAITLSVNAFVKHLTHRSRPAAHFCESEQAVVPCPPDTRLSFFSGHTSSAFAAAVATGRIADFHHLENRKWIWASGLAFATTTGVLRVMSDQHYASDVLTGVAAGGLAGWLIPKLHKPDAAPPASVRARPSPAAVAAVPVVILTGRSPALVSAGFAGGGPYVGVRWQW
jgi:membrane-associated phospholipid phosphatase